MRSSSVHMENTHAILTRKSRTRRTGPRVLNYYLINCTQGYITPALIIRGYNLAQEPLLTFSKAFSTMTNDDSQRAKHMTREMIKPPQCIYVF